MYNKIIGIIGGGPNSVYATDILLKNILKKYKKKLKFFFLIRMDYLDMEIHIILISQSKFY